MAIIQNEKISQYAWNSAPIDGTYIPRSTATIDREFHFPLDVELDTTSIFNEYNSKLFSYISNISIDANFTVSVLNIFIEDRRTAHQERHNKDKLICKIMVGEVVKAHVQVNSVTSKGVVGKLSYRAKGPFIITADLVHNSFEVK